MLGYVHTGVGDADNVFGGYAMHRETGYTEACGDAVLGQHSVSRDPQPQTFREYLGLLHTGFRHEDDELVATVASDHVGLPALLLEQTSHARQDQVALEVTGGVVHLLELIQIDENN